MEDFMFRALLPILDRWIGLRHADERDRVFLVEKLAAFVPRMPWIYAILLVNLGGLMVSLSWDVPNLLIGGAAMCSILMWRLSPWLRVPERPLTCERALNELRRLVVRGIALSGWCWFWFRSIYRQSGGDAGNHIVLFGS